MQRDFYKTDSEILKYNRVKGNTEKELKKKLLYMVMCSNENYQRKFKELDDGVVEVTLSGLSDDLYKFSAKKYNLSKSMILTYLNELVEEGLIEVIEKGSYTNSSSSFYWITTYKKTPNFIRTDNRTDVKTDNRTKKTSDCNSLNDAIRTDNRTGNETENSTSKKELIKRINKKEINSASSEALWKLYPNKKNKSRAMKDIPKLIKKYGYEQMEQCVYRYMKYVEDERKNGFKDLKYQVGSTFFNGTYVDYLNENYQEQPNEQQSKTVNGKKYDEYGFEIITCD